MAAYIPPWDTAGQNTLSGSDQSISGYTPPWVQRQQRVARAARATPSSDNGGGFLGLGLGNVADMPGNMVQGLAQLGVGLVTNPTEVIPAAAEGLGRSFLSTADTLTGGLLHKPLSSIGGGGQYVQPFWNRRGGILPGLIEDTMNVAMGGAGVEAVANASVRSAAAAGALASEAGDTAGAAEAAARAESAAAVANKAHMVAHPLQSIYREGIKPFAAAAESRKLAAAGVVSAESAPFEAAQQAVAQGPLGDYLPGQAAAPPEEVGVGAPEVHPAVQSYVDRYGEQHNLAQPTPVDTTLPDLHPAARETFANTYNEPDFATPGEPKTQAAYAALNAGVDTQFQHLTAPVADGGLGIRVVPVPEAEPYASAADQAADVARGQLKVSTSGGAAHELMTADQNFKFRAVHDFFGHIENGNDFSRAGEETAYQAHARMFNEEARPALATETRGQNAALIQSKEAEIAAGNPEATGAFPEQKAGLMPERMANPAYGHTTMTPESTPIAPLVAAPTVDQAAFAGERSAMNNDPFEINKEIMQRRAQAVAQESLKPRGRVGQFLFGATTPGEERLSLGDRLLSGVHERIQASEISHAMRVEERTAQTVVRALESSPLVKDTVAIAAEHVLPLVNGDTIEASHIAGDEIKSRLTGIRDFQNTLGISDETAMSLGWRQTAVPDALVNNPAWEADIQYAADQWKQQRIDATAAMQETRLGNKGLPAAGEEDRPLLSKDDQRVLKKAQGQASEALRAEGAVQREAMRDTNTLASQNDVIGQLTTRIGAFQAARDAIAGVFDAARSGLPTIWDGSAKSTATWEVRAGQMVEALHNEDFAGFSWSPFHDSMVTAPRADMGRYVVSIFPNVPGIPLATVTPELIDAIAKHYQAAFDGQPQLVLGGWVDPKTGLAYIEPSEVVRTRSEAVRLGVARGQKAVWDLKDSTSIDTTTGRPDIAGQFIDKHLFRDRRSESLHAAIDDGKLPKLSHEDVDEAMALQDAIATTWAGTREGKIPDDYFRNFEYQTRATQPKSWPVTGALAQNVMNLKPGLPLYHEIVDAGYDTNKMLTWYQRSHDAIEKWGRGREITLLNGHQIDAADLAYQLLAVTSVSASPATNLGNTLTGVANLKDFLTNQGAQMDNVKSLIDEFEHTPSEKMGGPRSNSFRTETPLFKHLANDTHMYVQSQQGVYEILSGHTFDPYPGWDGWTNDYIRTRAQMFGGASKSLSARNVTPDMIDAMRPMAQEQIARGAAGTEDSLARELAIREYHGSNALAKLLSFHDNLSHPDTSLGVTLDSWMARGFGADDHQWERVNNYHDFAVKVRGMADDMSTELGRPVKPNEVQALLWGYIKTEISRQNAGIALAYGSDMVDAIRAGTWTADTDPWQQYLDLTTGPMQDRLDQLGAAGKEKAPVVERQVPVVRNVREVEDAATLGDRATETYRTIVGEGPNEIREYLAAAETHAGVQREITQLIDEGDKAGAIDVANKLVNEEVRSVTDEDWRDFADIMDHPTAKVQESLNSLAPYGLGLPDTMASQLSNKLYGLTVLGGENEKMVVQLFQDADFTTLVHENAHLWRQLIGDKDLAKLEQAYGIRDGVWTRDAEERVANDFVGYLGSGKVRTSWLTPIFDRTRAVLNTLWTYVRDAYSGNRMGINIPQGARDMIDTYLNPEQLPTELTPGFKEREIPAEPRQLGKEARTTPTIPQATPKGMYQRGVTSGKEAEKFAESQRREAITIRQRAQVMRQRDTLQTAMIEGTRPQAQRQALLSAKAARTLERFVDSADHPSLSRVPAQWQPLWKATTDLIDEAKNNPLLAAELDKLPQTFTELIARAEQLGWDPVHVRNFTPAQTDALVYRTMKLGRTNEALGTEVAAKTRAVRRFSEKSGYASIESLVAAANELTWEARTNGVVDMVEKTFAQVVGPDGTIPDRFVPWGPRRASLVETNPATAERTVQPGDLVIPKTVDDVLRRWTKDYSHPSLAIAKKITSPWKTFVLTLSPKWYVHRIFGNMVLATIDGAKLQDWVRAWNAYRAEAIPEGVKGNTFVEASTGEKSLFPPATGIDGLKQAYDNRGATGALSHVTGTLGRSHEVIDEIARTAVYFKGIRTGLLPDVAMNGIYKALVDYNDLSPFERQVVQAVVPFYPWMKGLLKIGLKFPIDHPRLTAISFYLDRLNQDIQQKTYGTVLPHGYRGVIDLPILGSINTRTYNPLLGAGTLLTPQGIETALNPFLDMAVRAGLNAPKPGTGVPGIGEYGQKVSNVDALKALQDLGVGLPQAQAVAPSAQGATLPAAGARFLGLPLMSDAQTKALAARTTATLTGAKAPTALGSGAPKKGVKGAAGHTAARRVTHVKLPKIKGIRRSHFRRGIGTSTPHLLKGINRARAVKVARVRASRAKVKVG